MKNKLTLIILSMTILLCGAFMVSCDSKPKGNDYVGTWLKEDSGRDTLIIKQESDNTFSIERTSTRENVIGELKDDGLIHGKLAGFDFLYSLKDGVITETTPKKTFQYKKQNN